jgi:putative Ca2+/H+ antiporter (TMEM165/GDT1 family)
MPSDPGLAAFGSSFTAITLAELGDKTFFVALLLAARHRGRWVFLGSFGALALVTVVSLALGYGLKQLLPPGVVPWLAAVLFGGFGLKLLIDAQAMGADAAAEEAEEAGELVEQAEAQHPSATAWGVIREAFGLVFVAELGDRTQFATLFLATAPGFSFGALLAGSLLGHALVTWLAVGSGKWIGQRISEQLLFRLSGGLFLVFALFSLHQALA